MSLLVAQNLSLSFGERIILDRVSFRIGNDDRIGLVGPNGSGKSTLLRILSGEQGYGAGDLQFARGCQIGYLPQDILELKANTLLNFVLESVPGKKKLDEQVTETITRLEAALSENEQLEIANELAYFQNRLEYYDLHYSEHEAQKILFGLGFTQNDLDRPISEFSGGWKMRVALAAILFRKPELILLDEPTNHLDVPSVIWFDEFLQTFSGALILVSHDRLFLNNQINRIMSFEPEGLRLYNGNYDQYQLMRTQEEELLEARAKNIDKERKELEKFVSRFKAKATKARQAQSRVKMIARLEEKAPKPIQVKKTIHFSFPEAARSSYEVVKIKNLDKAFAEHVIFHRLNCTVYRGDRIALIGKNGIGKTTLLKMIAGEIDQDNGNIQFGTNVILHYYAQHHTEILNQQNSLLQELTFEAPYETQTRIRTILGAFLFSGDDVDKPIKVLSGGEKARVALAKLMLKPGNLLIMDEPTNHLDIHSSEMLAKALAEFNGTVLFVSHNRSFINRLATRVWDLQPDGLTDYSGNLEEYLDHLKLLHETYTPTVQKDRGDRAQKKGQASIQSQSGPVQEKPKVSPQSQNVAKNKKQWLDEKKQHRETDVFRRNTQKQLKNLTKKLDQTELAIASLEDKVKEAEARLAQPSLYQHEQLFNELLNDYTRDKEKLDQLIKVWESCSAEIEALQKEIDRLDADAKD
ncbi:ATP-binding cassette domain-containing protein [bacterium]|nr:ATP-binding cassette domain-containing protein [bacterium]